MNLAARCPSCGTVFRVVQDQLRVSEGWVRCGRCNNVFNAAAVLFDIDNGASAQIERDAEPPPPEADDSGSEPTVTDWTAPPAAPATAQGSAAAGRGSGQAAGPEDAGPVWQPNTPPPAADRGRPAGRQEPGFDADTNADTNAATNADADNRTGSAWSAPVRTEPMLGQREAPRAGTQRNGPAERQEPLLRTPSLPSTAPGPDPAVTAPLARAALRSPLSPALRPSPSRPAALADATLAPPLPSFLRAADQAARWRRPAMRMALGIAVVVLAAGLLLQAALLWRDTLAARLPASEPALRALCRLTGCQVQPLRRIDALAVDSSGLNRLDGSALYRLQLVLRNRADTAVLAPALDLSLTDAQGKLVARRTLSLADLGAPQSVLQAGQELPIQVLMATGEQRVAGYTLELFYP